MVGLDAAGKTTILYWLRLGEVITTIPTIGFIMESVEDGTFSFTSWDVGGSCILRPLFRHIYCNPSAFVMVVDSTDRDRIEEAREELHKSMADDELRNAVLLVFANKQDLPHAMPVDEISDRLQLFKFHHHKWFIQASCAITGDGLHEGFDWVVSMLS